MDHVENKTDYLLSIAITITNYGTILGWYMRGSFQEGTIITWNDGVKATKALFLRFH